MDKHSQSRALKYFSFNEQRMASNKNNDKKLIKTINSVGIVGGGTMGRGIAMSTADANIKTVIVEKTENEILATMKNIEGTYKKSSAYKSGISILLHDYHIIIITLIHQEKLLMQILLKNCH